MRHPQWLAGAALLACAGARPALACAPCGCGDPTLVAAGAEQPFRNRVRAVVAASYRSERSGRSAVARVDVDEARAELSVGWAPSDRLFLLGTLPFVHRSVRDASLAEQRTSQLGDAELLAKLFVWRERAFAPRHLVSWGAGAKLATAPWQRSELAAGTLAEVQSGSGAWSALFTAGYAGFYARWSLYAGLRWTLPLVTRTDYRPGSALAGSVSLQHQTFDWLALRAALDTRLSQRARELSEQDPDSGGLFAQAGADALFGTLLGCTLLVGGRAPLLNVRTGALRQGAVANLALIYDF